MLVLTKSLLVEECINRSKTSSLHSMKNNLKQLENWAQSKNTRENYIWKIFVTRHILECTYFVFSKNSMKEMLERHDKIMSIW